MTDHCDTHGEPGPCLPHVVRVGSSSRRGYDEILPIVILVGYGRAVITGDGLGPPLTGVRVMECLPRRCLMGGGRQRGRW